jgi:hypothetical protein
LKKHVYREHPNLQEMGIFFLQRVTKTQSEKQATKKRKIVPPFQIINFFSNQHIYNKLNLLQHAFLEDLVLYVYF